MEEKTKQRFIGLIVIIGALFIILPFLFHNSRPSLQTSLSTNAPNSNVTVALPTAATTGENTSNTSVTNNNNPTSTMQTQPSNATTSTTTQNQNADTNVSSTITQSQTPSSTTTTTTPQQVTTPQTTDMTTQTVPSTSSTTTTQTTTLTTPATTTTTSDSLAPASPNALTTGQENEGPTQPVQAAPATQNTTIPNTTLPNTSATTPAKHVVKKHVAIKKQELTRLPIHANTSAWEIQVAVFSDKENAEKMITKLRAHHFEAYSRRVAVNRRHYIAIFVGPEINYARAEILQKDLRRDFRLSGEIKKYQV